MELSQVDQLTQTSGYIDPRGLLTPDPQSDLNQMTNEARLLRFFLQNSGINHLWFSADQIAGALDASCPEVPDLHRSYVRTMVQAVALRLPDYGLELRTGKFKVKDPNDKTKVKIAELFSASFVPKEEKLERLFEDVGYLTDAFKCLDSIHDVAGAPGYSELHDLFLERDKEKQRVILGLIDILMSNSLDHEFALNREDILRSFMDLELVGLKKVEIDRLISQNLPSVLRLLFNLGFHVRRLKSGSIATGPCENDNHEVFYKIEEHIPETQTEREELLMRYVKQYDSKTHDIKNIEGYVKVNFHLFDQIWTLIRSNKASSFSTEEFFRKFEDFYKPLAKSNSERVICSDLEGRFRSGIAFLMNLLGYRFGQISEHSIRYKILGLRWVNIDDSENSKFINMLDFDAHGNPSNNFILKIVQNEKFQEYIEKLHFLAADKNLFRRAANRRETVGKIRDLESLEPRSGKYTRMYTVLAAWADIYDQWRTLGFKNSFTTDADLAGIVEDLKRFGVNLPHSDNPRDQAIRIGNLFKYVFRLRQ